MFCLVGIIYITRFRRIENKLGKVILAINLKRNVLLVHLMGLKSKAFIKAYLATKVDWNIKGYLNLEQAK